MVAVHVDVCPTHTGSGETDQVTASAVVCDGSLVITGVWSDGVTELLELFGSPSTLLSTLAWLVKVPRFVGLMTRVTVAVPPDTTFPMLHVTVSEAPVV